MANDLPKAEFFKIVSSYGTHVAFQPENGVLVHSSSHASGELTACRFKCAPHTIFLFDGADQPQTLSMTGNPFRAPILPFRLGRTHDKDQYVLCHPLTGRHMSAELPGNEETSALSVTQLEASSSALFSLVPSDPSALTKQQTVVVSSLNTLLSRVHSGYDVITAVQSLETIINGACFAAVVIQLTIADIEVFSRKLVTDQVATQNLANSLSNDIWASQALPELAKFLQNSNTENSYIQAIGPNLDFIADAGTDGQYCSLGHLVNALARRQVLPRRPICIVATCRNEGPYLVEWISYHRAIGVDKFFLYSNNNDDESDILLNALNTSGVITWIPNEIGAAGSPQYKSYGHALQLLPDILNYEWALFIDIDEFFVFDINIFNSIVDYFYWQSTQPVDAVALSWLVYGPGSAGSEMDDPVHQRFHFRRPHADAHIKSACRPRLFLHSHCHFPVWDEYITWHFRGSARGTHPKIRDHLQSSFSPRPSGDFAWINHYISKSATEFLTRRSMPRAELAASTASPLEIFTDRHVRWFRDLYETVDDVLDDRISKCCGNFEVERESLMRLPGVANACATIAEASAARLKALRQLVEKNPRFSVEGSNEQWFRTLLAS